MPSVNGTGVTLNFLQKALDEAAGTSGSENPPKILSFESKIGTKPGDNYTSVIYSVDVHIQPNEHESDQLQQTRHLFVKSFPEHPQRQESAKGMNIFFKEHQFYTRWVPELKRMQIEILNLKEDEVVEIPYPQYIHGECVDYYSSCKKADDCRSSPFENYIILEDLRKNKGFRMTNRRHPLDLAHMKLVIIAMAKTHALSWAYRHHVESNIVEKFPYFKKAIKIDNKFSEMWKTLFTGNVNQAKEILENEFGPGNIYSEATENFKQHFDKVKEFFFGNERTVGWEQYFRLPPDEERFGKDSESPEEWTAICHGDCWTNNMLFRYDVENGEPLQVVLVDLQIAHENCVTRDLVHAIYACSDHTLRHNHLNDLLQLYYETILQCCANLKCPAFPGFSMDSLKFRFHRGKLLGYKMTAVILPITLKEEGKEIPLEEMGEGENMFDALIKESCDLTNETYKQRLIGTVKELVNDGVL